jgi:hypothetical protein
MAKGCNYNTAAGRVMNLWGSNALHYRSISKSTARAEEAELALLKQANEVWLDGDAADRCDALRKARLDNPRIYRVLSSRG